MPLGCRLDRFIDRVFLLDAPPTSARVTPLPGVSAAVGDAVDDGITTKAKAITLF